MTDLLITPCGAWQSRRSLLSLSANLGAYSEQACHAEVYPSF
jgi:hypothetical protein